MVFVGIVCIGNKRNKRVGSRNGLVKPINALEAILIYNQYPYFYTLPTFEFLHFVIVSSMAVYDDKIHPDTSFVENDGEVKHFWSLALVKLSIIDVGIVDTEGKLE